MSVVRAIIGDGAGLVRSFAWRESWVQPCRNDDRCLSGHVDDRTTRGRPSRSALGYPGQLAAQIASAMDPAPSTVLSSTPVEALGPLNDVELRNAPEQFFLAGDASLLRAGPRVAIVGARKASREGQLRAMRLARLLVDHGIIVVSGLAEGIDTAAHTAAIDRGGRTIAVIGTPVSRAYPASNRELQALIRRDHLVLSQFREDLPVLRHNFVLRNRTMALVAHASVIVEASDTSGSLSQGWEALRLGRPLFLMRSVVEDTRLSWPREMLHFGAQVLSEPEDVLSELPPERFAPAIDAPF